MTGRVAIAAIVGGILSRTTGGKFANGALTAGMAQLLNNETRAVAAKNVVDSTREAWEHYMEGNGEEVELDPKRKRLLLESEEHKLRSQRIREGLTSKMEGNYGVDFTEEMFHIGRTTVHYEIVCSGNTCTTKYTGFVRVIKGKIKPDGF